MQRAWRYLIALIFVVTPMIIVACNDAPTGPKTVTGLNGPNLKRPQFDFWVCPSGEINADFCTSGTPEYCADATPASGAYCATGTTCTALTIMGGMDQCAELPTVDPCLEWPWMCDGGGGGGGGGNQVFASVTTTVDCSNSTTGFCAPIAEQFSDVCTSSPAAEWVELCATDIESLPNWPVISILWIDGVSYPDLRYCPFGRTITANGVLTGVGVTSAELNMTNMQFFQEIPQKNYLTFATLHGGPASGRRYKGRTLVVCATGQYYFAGIQFRW